MILFIAMTSSVFASPSCLIVRSFNPIKIYNNEGNKPIALSLYFIPDKDMHNPTLNLQAGSINASFSLNDEDNHQQTINFIVPPKTALFANIRSLNSGISGQLCFEMVQTSKLLSEAAKLFNISNILM